MITHRDSDRAFWSLILDYSRNISGIFKFIYEGAVHHLPVMSKDQFNTVKRVSKCAHDLGQLACSMLSKINEDEKG